MASKEIDQILVPFRLRTHAQILEEYVQARILQFARVYARHLPIPASMGSDEIDEAASLVYQALPPPLLNPPTPPSAENVRQLHLVLRHACRCLGCDDQSCELCMHNPNRKCVGNLGNKYLIEDPLRPRCNAPIFVHLVDTDTGQDVYDIEELQVEASIINGVTYDELQAQQRDAAEGPPRPPPTNDVYEAMIVAHNKDGAPLLVLRGGSVDAEKPGPIVFDLKDGMVELPDMYATASSEALLSGRKPPYRLFVRPSRGAVPDDVCVLGAVSEPFVVATKRVRTAGKVELPCVNDDVSKLKHMGKETVKKLRNLSDSAQQAGVVLPADLPVQRVTKVRHFQQLARFVEPDPQLVMKLQSLLKLNKGRWKEACEHAESAVLPDSRMRVWYADKNAMDAGLLFECRLGNMDLERPLGLLQQSVQADGEVLVRATRTAEHTPAQRELALQLKPQAVENWWHPGHPGWAIYPADSEHFANTGELYEAQPDLALDTDQPHHKTRAKTAARASASVRAGSGATTTATGAVSHTTNTAGSPGGVSMVQDSQGGPAGPPTGGPASGRTGGTPQSTPAMPILPPAVTANLQHAVQTVFGRDLLARVGSTGGFPTLIHASSVAGVAGQSAPTHTSGPPAPQFIPLGTMLQHDGQLLTTPPAQPQEQPQPPQRMHSVGGGADTHTSPLPAWMQAPHQPQPHHQQQQQVTLSTPTSTTPGGPSSGPLLWQTQPLSTIQPPTPGSATATATPLLQHHHSMLAGQLVPPPPALHGPVSGIAPSQGVASSSQGIALSSQEGGGGMHGVSVLLPGGLTPQPLHQQQQQHVHGDHGDDDDDDNMPQLPSFNGSDSLFGVSHFRMGGGGVLGLGGAGGVSGGAGSFTMQGVSHGGGDGVGGGLFRHTSANTDMLLQALDEPEEVCTSKEQQQPQHQQQQHDVFAVGGAPAAGSVGVHVPQQQFFGGGEGGGEEGGQGGPDSKRARRM